MMEQEHFLLGEPAVPQLGASTVPEQRNPLSVPYRNAPERELPSPATGERRPSGGRLRVDARRNLESVLRAAREVFGELGYDAPMEEVARRAGVGVGTVYRRFPSKEVLVQRIAAEEVAWLTARAKEALYGTAGPWEALAAYLATAVASGAGRLLPPEAFGYAEELARVPEQQPSWDWDGGPTDVELSPAEPRSADVGDQVSQDASVAPDADPRLLLRLLAALVSRAAAAGELRAGVTVSEIVLVLTAAVPPSIGRGAALNAAEPAERLLRILLDGLRVG
ncbi:AcrR family transcriptional regulator [Kitasatospora sp. MAP12-15]|uniref:TetR/AcrR family transcriptional regulator n=1 Tax=unclassified Kitasatospora TaxID=2633591 RepID=UPI002475E568|nr:helix-turn-helix domain-containing protein [Kitasatospora sp. MAP12-44]MDH6112190.1 AcrR family transcriptional regulator [Kitasatospora sp. MAP12-44]